MPSISIPEWSESDSYTQGQVVAVGGISLYRAGRDIEPGSLCPVLVPGAQWAYLGHLEYQGSETPPQLIEQAEVVEALEKERSRAQNLEWKIGEIRKLIGVEK